MIELVKLNTGPIIEQTTFTRGLTAAQAKRLNDVTLTFYSLRKDGAPIGMVGMATESLINTALSVWLGFTEAVTFTLAELRQAKALCKRLSLASGGVMLAVVDTRNHTDAKFAKFCGMTAGEVTNGFAVFSIGDDQ